MHTNLPPSHTTVIRPSRRGFQGMIATVAIRNAPATAPAPSQTDNPTPGAGLTCPAITHPANPTAPHATHAETTRENPGMRTIGPTVNGSV